MADYRLLITFSLCLFFEVEMNEQKQPMSGLHMVKAEGQAQMRAMMGPMMVDNSIRQAIQHCWMMLPEDNRTIDALEKEIERLVKRAFENIREDTQSFGIDL
jgi:carbonic anhydrase